jgi:hypothetical protein
VAKSSAAYEEYRDRQAEISRERSRTGREIGPLPEVAHPRRKKRCRRDLREFCDTYLRERFPIPWSDDHFRAMRRLQTCVLDGGRFAFAMPRGSGKTSLSEAASLWAVLYGHRRFAVLIGATESAAEENLESVKVELETNDRLAEDFPEVCYPIRKLEGIAHRAPGQTLDGERTRLGWTGKELVLPTVAGSPASGALVRVTGITGRIRGMRAATAEGQTIRPDLVIIDDPQTDESARSPTQNAYRENVLAGAVLGLAGPAKKIAAVMPCTVISPGDMADRILDRDRHPEWNGERTKLMYAMPEREDLWQEYARVRAEGMRGGDDGRAGTEFYRANREEMDAGAKPAWEQRFNPDELSAIQHAMNLHFDNPRAFAAEYQNEPISENDVADLAQVEADPVASRLNRLPAGAVPRDCSRLTAGVDVQGRVIYWLLAAWDERFGGAIVDYGTFPRQNRAYFAASDARPSLEDAFPGMSEEARIYAGLKAVTTDILARSYRQHETGADLRVERALVDSGWKTEVVHQFCRTSPLASVVMPSKGRGVRAGDKPFREWSRKPGDRTGRDWRIDAASRGQGRFVLYDANSWKSFLAERLLCPVGSPGTVWLPGTRPHEHQLLADHLSAEFRQKTEGRGRTVEEWRLRPEATENHWLDCLVLAAVAASVQGLDWDPAGAAGESIRDHASRKVKLSEIQARKRTPPP